MREKGRREWEKTAVSTLDVMGGCDSFSLIS